MGGNRELERGLGLEVKKRVVAQDKKKEEGSEEGAKIEDLSPLFTPKAQRSRPGLMTRIRAKRV